MGSYDNYDYDDNDYDELSKAVIPQQFYKDLDDELDDLPRHEYTKRLLKLCTDDCYRVSDYRTRLSERARGFPNCPETRLVNRRNSVNASLQQKLATDCYVLQAFFNGERSKEIFDMFVTSSSNPSDSSTNLTLKPIQKSATVVYTNKKSNHIQTGIMYGNAFIEQDDHAIHLGIRQDSNLHMIAMLYI